MSLRASILVDAGQEELANVFTLPKSVDTDAVMEPRVVSLEEYSEHSE